MWQWSFESKYSKICPTYLVGMTSTSGVFLQKIDWFVCVQNMWNGETHESNSREEDGDIETNEAQVEPNDVHWPT